MLPTVQRLSARLSGRPPLCRPSRTGVHAIRPNRLLCAAPFSPPAAPVAAQEERAPESVAGPPGPYGLLHRIPRAAPYLELARVEKPIGSMLLYWPGAWSISLAAEPGGLPDPYLLGAFGIGALLMRGAGCTVNDLWDRDIDKKVARTKMRPLARGAVSPKQAVLWLAVQLGLSAGVLFSLEPAAVVLGAASLGLVGIYPAMKRVTGWPQLVLGLTFNWGALLGWVAVHNQIENGYGVVVPLYAGGVAWTLVYDTIYAHQDKKDDALLGLGSTALTLGDGARAKAVLAGFSTVTIGGLLAAGNMAGVGTIYYPMILLGAGHLAWQVKTVDFSNGQDCMSKFISNQYFGALVFGACVLGNATATSMLV